MENKTNKYKAVTDRIIITTFVITILSGIALMINNSVHGNRLLGLNVVVISIFLLGTYIVTEKLFKEVFSIVPETFYYIAVIFAFFSTYLGSIMNFYERFYWWDDMLHFVSGILLGMLFIIITSFLVIKRFGKLSKKHDIITIVVIGVLVSISIAVFWEFYEFTYDFLFDGNMQRSLIITDPKNFDVTPYLRPSGRFVDPGLLDTMGDFLQAVTGAVLAGIYCVTHYMIISDSIVDYSNENDITIEDYLQKS